MNILFLFQRFSFKNSDLYLDLVKECVAKGHKVYVLAGTSEDVDDSRLVLEEGCHTAYVKLPDQFRAGKIRKGLIQLLIEPIFIGAMKRLLWGEKIDLVVYPTPPITLAGVVKTAKKHFGAKSYLMLKDIFPQNAVDLGMMGTGLLFKYFKYVEKRLYAVSDRIGCMSPANVEYLKLHSPETSDKLEIFPNAIHIQPLEDNEVSEETNKSEIVNFVFGGNLGKPQAVDFLLEGIKTLRDKGEQRARFLIIGEGTEAAFVERYISENNLENVSFRRKLPRDEYEKLLGQQDVGIISLSSKFTVPNFPSRLLSYMHMAKPVYVITDRVTDMGEIVVGAKCGFFSASDDITAFVDTVKEIIARKSELKAMGANGRKYLIENYNVTQVVKILERFHSTC